MFTKFYDALYSGLTADLTAILTDDTDPVERLSSALPKIAKALLLLRKRVLSVAFPSEEIEILFFKTVKPRFYALRIFHSHLYTLEMNRPVGTREMLKSYYLRELEELSRFFIIHTPLYQYYKTGRTELDHFYFRRGVEIPCLLIPEMPDPDEAYSTAMDYMYAKFIGYEMLQEEILKKITALDTLPAPAVPGTKPEGKRGLIQWTGKIVNLGELIYGLYYTGQLNHGNVQLSEIVVLFERMFSVKIRDVHHTFGEIRERKVTSPSKFLDAMAAAIRDRVDEDLKYKPK